MTTKEVAKLLGKSKRTVRDLAASGKLKGQQVEQGGRSVWLFQDDDVKKFASLPQRHDPDETQRRTDNTWDISLRRTRIHTLDAMVEKFEIDLDVWQVVEWTANKWDVAGKADAGFEVEELYQCKLRMRQRKGVVETKAIIEKLKRDSLKDIKFRAPAVHCKPPSSGNLGELAIADPHFGKYAWAGETGHEDYDLNICRERYRNAVDSAIYRFKQEQVERILLPIGNDLLHVDNEQGTTTSGTPQDLDGRQPKVYETAFDEIERAVELCRQVAPTDLLLVRGNHDEFGSWTLSHALHVRFKGYPDVNVDYSPQMRKAYEWGSNLLVFTHGKHENRRKLPTLALSEFREQAGRAKYIEIHTGDLHQVRLEEEFGVRVRILPSFAAADAWHAKKGYVKNIPQAEAYVFNKEKGMIGLWPWTVTA